MPEYGGLETVHMLEEKAKRDKVLTELLRKAANHKMTARERWEQRVSFVYGNLMFLRPKLKREDVEKRATEMYGPKPDKEPDK